MKLKFVAEIGNNHNGDIALAKRMVDAAFDAQADYIKFQIYNIKNFVARGNTCYEELERERLTYNQYIELKDYVEEKGCNFLATPFDRDSAKLVNKMCLPVVKISSGDFNNFWLLDRAVTTDKVLFLSVGGGNLSEIDQTVAYLKDRKIEFCLLHCIVSYPAQFEELNLKFIQTLKKRYGCPVGFSDHSIGIEASLGAIAMGAVVIEKHFTIDKKLPGGDNDISILPDEFAQMVIMGKNIYQALGEEVKQLSANEQKIRRVINRKVYASREISKGCKIRGEDLSMLRPDNPDLGIAASDYQWLIGRTARMNIMSGQMILEDMVDG